MDKIDRRDDGTSRAADYETVDLGVLVIGAGAAGARTAIELVDRPETEQEYEEPESVRQTILNLVGADAVGRAGYSDRGGYTADADGSTEAESF